MKRKTKLLRAIGLTMALVTTMLLHSKMSHFSIDSSMNTPNEKNIDAKEEEAPKEYENIYNPKALEPFFEKLNALDIRKDRKLNIVHIGDSHIQGDAMTNQVRQRFQSQFGNGGLGIVFPYSLIRTNGEHNVRFSSNITWDSQKNTSKTDTDAIGITGYSLLTNNKNFVIELNLKNKDYSFNTLRILTPNNKHLFDLATSRTGISIKPIKTPPTQITHKTLSHKVQKGETLYALSRKYKTTESKIQSLNHLKGTTIREGAILKIPTEEKIVSNYPTSQPVNLDSFDILSNSESSYGYTYNNLEGLNKIYLTPNTENNTFALNGIILENDQNGVIYHTIGVNGARFSDYNRCNLFFEQIQALHPDLIIVSLGTNETFGKLSAENYDKQVEIFIEQIRSHYGDCPILLTSPPPSLFKKKLPNPLCEQYTNILIDNSVKVNYGVFDLYNLLGGSQAMSQLIAQNLIANDRVHYTHEGYIEQGGMLFDALMSNYLKYKNQQK
ncbi:LysM peptidoglycan-binding domain-containing protein [Capnocytophaga sp. G2]|jgi:GDSL-like Lipase/Acylhydrolase./LysM domain.|uniref:LysM peptidoglycan-binding domain-containing protein n=1 Tax=Capnocytophaga sp. G2 TaxID=3110695 RepID=UPI002B476FE1|nr:LysM peptidoglycan-binding domain-containing protein [Capnocytophaga sp. G2]MEB3004706.1 LysM peptidoglycan-binding domain-containing protein [Capnocytophaga sp. G2]